MKTFSDYFGKTLQFIQPSLWKRSFELRDGNEVIGSLTYPKFFSVKADVKIFDKRWEFYEPKWWKHLIEIREAGRELPVASFKPAVFKRKERMALPRGGGVTFSSSFFRTTVGLLDNYGSQLAVLNRKMNIKTKYEIQIEKRSEMLDEHPWILLLIIYVELNRSRRRSSG